jgi:hypothetical protein
MTEGIEKQLRDMGVYVSTTVGVSMKPMLRNRRDRVIIRPVSDQPLARFDVPLYRSPKGDYVLHRIIAIKDGHYVIRGDNTYALEHVPTDAVIGVLTEFYRGKRHVLVTQRSYRLYARLWNALYPARFVLHGVRLCLGRVKRKLFPKKRAGEER